MENFTEIFALVMEQLKAELSETSFELWFGECVPLGFEEGAVILSLSPFKRKIVEQQFIKQLHDAFFRALGFDPEICLVDAEPGKSAQPQKTAGSLISPPSVKDSLAHNIEENTFDTFVVGGSNKFAHAAAQAVAAAPGQRYNPLFIHGNSGLGKTHLLRAIHHEIARLQPGVSMIFTSGEEFTNEMIRYITIKDTEQFHQKFRSARVLLVDDVQFIAGRESTQEEFFHTFNSLIENGGQIVLCSDKPPKDMITLEERLRSRFERGLIADIQPPDLETRMAIIKRKAQRNNFDIPDDLADYIARQLKTNIRQLEGAVNKLEALVKLRGMPLNLHTAQHAIGDIITQERPLPVVIERVIEEAARTAGLTSAELRSRRRSAEISEARQIAMYVISQVTGISTQAIGQEFKRDHSTVVYALKEIRAQMAKDPLFKKRVEEVSRLAQET